MVPLVKNERPLIAPAYFRVTLSWREGGRRVHGPLLDQSRPSRALLFEDYVRPFACSVLRYGRFGWFVESIVGPENQTLPGEREKEITDMFRDLVFIQNPTRAT